jgi:hypothetical protein
MSKPVPLADFLPLDLYDLGTTGLMDYVEGRSPYYPHEPLVGKPPRRWRLLQAGVVVESRGGERVRAFFIEACNKRAS